MYWSGAENAGAVCRSIERAAAAHARICVFPELAVTGFHRRIAEAAKPDLVAESMRSIAATCARHSIAAAVGAPTFGEDGRIYNSQILVDERGQCAGVVEKKGLTDPEATFFARGAARPVVALQGRRCTAVICREIEDLDDVCAQIGDTAPEFIFWPGMMGPEEGAEPVDPPVHVQRAQDLARRTGAHVIQANWPLSLNYPEQSYKTGRSVVIAPSGDIEFALPPAQAGLAVFTLGDSSYAWEAVSP
jgi:omega-amidase